MPTYTFPSGISKIYLATGQRIVRVHQIGKGPLWFGPGPKQPPSYRFDAPAGEYRTMYGAQGLKGAFVETVLRQAKRIVARAFVDARGWTEFTCERDLIFAKAFDEGLIYHGVTADICSGDDYAQARRFAADIYAADTTVDGIAYRARHNNGQICYAIFDRVPAERFTIVEQHTFQVERAAVESIMREHGAVWDPMVPLAT